MVDRRHRRRRHQPAWPLSPEDAEKAAKAIRSSSTKSEELKLGHRTRIVDGGMHPDRRSEPRWIVDGARFEPLWLVAKGALGGQATLFDASRKGLQVIVSRRQAYRLVAALTEVQRTGELVDVARIPRNGHRRARVVWVAEAESQLKYFGLALTEPLDTLDEVVQEP